ncbi:hypothetical protein OTU49_009657 [Cherax quadricarinatus]|uniref:Uncharacterized protein n=1 Tax=Cherax quadricarinatus TaxID=27406 RepID=A0AAW0WAI7_CHEQU
MNADDLMENNDVDHSIITGLGCNPSSVIDNDGILDITAPQATSTVGNKKSREDLTRQYLCTLEEASEGLSGEFEQLKRIGSVAAPLSRPLNVCPLKNVDVKVKIPENQTSASLEAESKSRHSSGLMTGIPLIRIDGLSDLSSSRFLVDHTNLSTGELTRAQLEWDHLRDTKQPDDYKLNMEDDQCSELLPSSEISVQPSEFVLAPKENRDIFIAATGTANMLAKAPGCVGVLQVISGDEILRQRFRRLKNKEVKIRRINDPSLLKINWDSVYTGKKEVQNEEDCLPPQPEDSAVFFNSCSKIQIQLYGERQAHDDASSTVFACLNADDTVSLEADITAAAGDRLIDTHQPSAHGFTSHQLQKCSNVLQAAATTETGINITWDVFPQCLSILASDVSPHIFFVVNLNNIQQMFEATSDCRWLGIEPREAILPSLSSVKVLVKLEPSRMPQVINPLTHTLKIMCENESRCATITVLPTGGENSAAQSLTVSKQLPSASPPVQQSPVPSTDSLAPKPLIDLQAPELKIPSVRYPSTSANPETTTKTNVANTGRSQTNESEVKHMGSTESLVQLVSDIINFPDTATMKENYVKVKLRNLDGLVHVVRAVVVKGPFALRHTQFSIKSGHYVSVPVYFRPQKAGMYSGQLMLTVLEEQTILPVQLYGRAV